MSKRMHFLKKTITNEGQMIWFNQEVNKIIATGEWTYLETKFTATRSEQYALAIFEEHKIPQDPL